MEPLSSAQALIKAVTRKENQRIRNVLMKKKNSGNRKKMNKKIISKKEVEKSNVSNIKKEANESTKILHSGKKKKFVEVVRWTDSEEIMLKDEIDWFSHFDQYLQMKLPLNLMENKSVFDEIVQTLKFAWKDRVREVGIYDINVSVENKEVYLVGIKLSSSWDNILTIGPPADLPESIEFRNFYGDLAELKKFPNGNICEVVTWTKDEKKDNHILANIAKTVLSMRVGKIDVKMHFPFDNLTTKSDEYTKIISTFESLASAMFGLKQLPLAFTTITCTSSFYRKTSSNPPFGDLTYYQKHTKRDKSVLKIAVGEEGFLPFYFPAMHVMATMESSGKFGHTHEIIEQFKIAFCLEIAKLLKERSFLAVPTEKGIYVRLNGYVFFVELGLQREIAVAINNEQKARENGVFSKDEFQRLKTKIRTVPEVSTLIYGLSQRFGAFSETCQLFKRFLSSHHILNNFDEFALELMVSEVFLRLDFEHGNAPLNLFAGFINVLRMIANHDFQEQPLFVDFSGELDLEKRQKFEKVFHRTRFILPPVVIYFTEEDTGTCFTKNITKTALEKLIQISQKALSFIKNEILFPTKNLSNQLFSEEFPKFDIELSLTKRCNIRWNLHRDATEKNFVRKNDFIPVVNFDPVEKFLQHLQDDFSSIATFYYDPSGVKKIGINFSREFLKPKAFKMNECFGKKQKIFQMVPNVLEFLETVKLYGTGIIERIHVSDEIRLLL